MSNAKDPSTIGRRSFLKNTGQSAALLYGGSFLKATSALGASSNATQDRPNILVYFTDEERPTAFSLPSLNMPNRQRILNNSVEFTNTICTYPLCSPSRATMLTGLYPHQAGVITNVLANMPELSADTPNVLSQFSEAGYEVGYFGKWDLSIDGNLEPYGMSAGNYFIPEDENNGRVSDPTTAQRAAQWITSRQSGKPWICFVSIINPHDIMFQSLQPIWESSEYPNRSISMPENYNDVLTRLPRTDVPRELKTQARLLSTPSEESEVKELMELYAFLIELSDQHLGTVLNALDASGQRDNTTIVYTSDHGDALPAHQVWQKPFMYEEAVRIPLLIHSPARYSSRMTVQTPTTNLDLIPTLASIAGIEWPYALPGRDLTALAANPPEDRAVLSEAALGMDTITPEVSDLTLMARNSRFKYVLYPSGDEQLFDLQNDPGEVTDLSESSEYQAQKKELASFISTEMENDLNQAHSRNATAVGAATALALHAACRPGGTIEMRLSSKYAGTARVQILTPAGRRVAELPQLNVRAGANNFVWNGRNSRGGKVPKATYIARLTMNSGGSGAKTISKRFTLSK
ncbi:MAG: sulfatase-like hydrolase/transferase [Chitinivibrionales bacterium]|nr:sulfatase-like hydrolase/transferase [Chitinivibrionales bacterium]MBD3359001.1 sulfatase-like hydrolase/transferase [Chitinivibrionales bacterium]